MQSVTDYRIYQRDKDGGADVTFSGTIPAAFGQCDRVYARAVREDDNLSVAPWRVCEREGDQWRTAMRLPEGGLYRLEACAHTGGAAIEWSPRIRNVSHVGVGELVLLTGQSNMAGYGRDLAYDPPVLGVHLYGNNGLWSVATHPLNDSIDTIYPENAEYASGTSPALSFARLLNKRLNVPVGLVQASLGGSPLSKWHPEEEGDLYRAMMRRIDAVGRVGGVAWYQGCSDANERDADAYLARFTRMIALWREALGDVPVVTVQLNRCVNPAESDRCWGVVREAQRQAARLIPGVSVVPTWDLAINDGIHNSAASNVVIGERMANAYLRTAFGLPGLLAPDVESVSREDDTHIFVRFADEFRVHAMDDFARGMDVEDDEGVTPCVSVVTTDDGLRIATQRLFGQNARFHAFWRVMPEATGPRDTHGLPMLSCYGVPIL